MYVLRHVCSPSSSSSGEEQRRSWVAVGPSAYQVYAFVVVAIIVGRRHRRRKKPTKQKTPNEEGRGRRATKKDSIPIDWTDLVDERAHLVLEAHLEHAIRLVEHDRRHAPQVRRARLDDASRDDDDNPRGGRHRRASARKRTDQRPRAHQRHGGGHARGRRSARSVRARGHLSACSRDLETRGVARAPGVQPASPPHKPGVQSSTKSGAR